MELIGADKNVVKENFFMKELHSHVHYEIYLLLKGDRTLFLSNEFVHLQAPSLIIIPPHELHMTGGGPFERINIDVSPMYLDNFEKSCLLEKSLTLYKLGTEEKEEFKKIFEALCSFRKKDEREIYLEKSLFKYFICLLDKLKSGERISSNANLKRKDKLPLLVLRVTNYLTENYSETHTLTSIAKKFYSSKGAIIYNFKKYLNCTPIDFLLNVRLVEAKKLLASTKLTITEISNRCGFSSANYFGVIFRKKEGVSPKKYRNLLIKH